MASWKVCTFEDIHQKDFTHLFNEDSRLALRAALGARRPLLVRGEPGVGKSQLAVAAARALGRAFVSEVITARTESQDLLYRFDAVARLGQAQVLSVAGRGDNCQCKGLEALEEKKFLQPGPLWWVFNWKDADDQYADATVKGARPSCPSWAPNWQPKDGSVLLIDEIDKADPDLPNGLLESLGNGSFHVPYLNEPVICAAEQQPPLVVITTNEERELPAAFLRRCLVLPLALPKGEELKTLLMERGQAHFGKQIVTETYRQAAEQLVKERERADPEGSCRPGQAEYLDILRALLEVAGEEPFEQQKVLESIAKFALKKNAPREG
jgi:MoxR-like ATPase